MIKRTLSSIITIAVCSLILVGSGLMGYFTANPDRGANTIAVDIGDGSDTVTFEGLALIPGESREYTLELKCEIQTECDVVLKFEEEGDKTLKNFVRVRIEYNGEEIKDALMADLFKSDELTFKSDLSKGKTGTIKITYYMPLEIGNEAEKAEADFKLHITVKNED